MTSTNVNRFRQTKFNTSFEPTFGKILKVLLKFSGHCQTENPPLTDLLRPVNTQLNGRPHASKPYSAYVGPNADYLWPARGLAPATLDCMIHLPGYTIDYEPTDLHTVMTYLVDQTLMPGDTLTIYSVLTTVRDGSLPVLLNSVNKAQRWFNDHIAANCLCCEGMRGNINHDPFVGTDISDLVYLVDYMFTGGPPPPCSEEADINGNGTLDIADLVHLVDYMFTGGPPPVACP